MISACFHCSGQQTGKFIASFVKYLWMLPPEMRIVFFVEQMLRKMEATGDALTERRCVDFDFIFPHKNKAKSFGRLVKGKNNEVEIARYGEFDWQAVVSYELIPTFERITAIESSLKKQAESVGGRGDGWTSFSFLTKGAGRA